MLALLGFLAGGTALVISWLVYAAAPRRKLNVLLALILFIEGVTMVWGGGIESLLLDAGGYEHHATLAGLHALSVFTVFLIPLYLVFIATALDVPLVKPFRPRWVQVGLVFAVVPVALYALSQPNWFWIVDETGQGRHGPFPDGYIYPFAAVSFFAFVAAIWAWRRSPLGTQIRRRAGIFAIAFGLRDGAWVLTATADWLADGGLVNQSTPAGLIMITVFSLFMLAYLIALGYGVLRERLFDIELKVKWAMKRSTVAALFLAVFFIVSETASQILGERTGSAFLGIAAAGILLFFLAPLQRFADRFADHAMPGVTDTKEYHLVRKREVYRSALEEALSDGSPSEKDRRMLAMLQDNLGITARDAFELERQTKATLEVA